MVKNLSANMSQERDKVQGVQVVRTSNLIRPTSKTFSSTFQGLSAIVTKRSKMVEGSAEVSQVAALNRPLACLATSLEKCSTIIHKAINTNSRNMTLNNNKNHKRN